MKSISVKEALQLPNAVFIDTRTPKEFEEARIPGAVNVPLFSNEERAIIGTLYKKKSRESAIEQGIEFYSKNLPNIFNVVSKYKDKTLIVHCWRGGMRSKAVASLLDSLGYNVFQMEGGHKAYRKYVIERLSDYVIKPKIVVISGLTGTGKTELLKLLPDVVDLEGLAQHRSSLFGAVGLHPVIQKMFECMLLKRLDEVNNKRIILFEGESRKIGDASIPENIYKKIKTGINIRLDCSMEKRVERTMKEYFSTEERISQVREIIQKMPKFMGHKKVAELLAWMDSKDYAKVVETLLRDYYDPKYTHTLKEASYDLVVDGENLEAAAAKILEFCKSI